jgi:hypothetical protein
MKKNPATDNGENQIVEAPYAEAVGSLLWAVMVSCPDIACAVGTLAQFVQKPSRMHWKALKRILAYLFTTRTTWLTFGGKEKCNITAYCDADWASHYHCHSISGYSFHMGQGAMMWSSKKQPIVMWSSTEAEYVALTHASKEALWLRLFLKEIRGEDPGAIDLLCDNQGAIAISKDNKFHVRMKHIDVCYHFIRENVANGNIWLEYVPTAKNVADLFTKAMPTSKLRYFAHKLGLGETNGQIGPEDTNSPNPGGAKLARQVQGTC